MSKNMKLKKIKNLNCKRNNENIDKKDLFTWAHRYLRLHSDLLADNIYQTMYDFFRNQLITYLKKDIENSKFNDMQLGELIDTFADAFNKEETAQVNEYKTVIEELYNYFKENASKIN